MRLVALVRFGVVASVYLVGCGAEADRILSKEQGANNQCHFKIETASDATRPGERIIVDHYGPCDETPSLRKPR